MAAANDPPDAIITESRGLEDHAAGCGGSTIAQALIDQTATVLPHVKITELLLEVDEWTGFTRHFTHLKSGDLAKDKNLLLTTIRRRDQPGLDQDGRVRPGTTYAKLAGCKPGTRDETYSTALLNWSTLSFGIPCRALKRWQQSHIIIGRTLPNR